MSNIEEQLTGTTWTLVSYQSADTNGDTLFPLGRDATGYIIFDQTGLFSVQIMADKRAGKIDGDLFQSNVEKQVAENGYHAYSGKYVIDEEKAVLKTMVQLSLVPDYVGSEQKRFISIEGDNLYLQNVNHPERKLVWKKVGA